MNLLCAVWHYFCLACGSVFVVSSALYLLPIVYLSLFARSQDLKKKYNASWALVTGGSSGIGKAVVKKLAKQVSHAFFIFHLDCCQLCVLTGMPERRVSMFALWRWRTT